MAWDGLVFIGNAGGDAKDGKGHMFAARSNELAADSGLSDDDIAVAVAVGGSTVYRTKRRFVEGISRPP